MGSQSSYVSVLFLTYESKTSLKYLSGFSEKSCIDIVILVYPY